MYTIIIKNHETLETVCYDIHREHEIDFVEVLKYFMGLYKKSTFIILKLVHYKKDDRWVKIDEFET